MTYRKKLLNKISTDVKEADIMAGNIQTRYIEAGSGFPVICLHGAAGGGVSWYPVMDRISSSYRVIAPDLVGYGETDKPDGEYDRPFFAGWLKAFMDSLKISQAHIIGLSQGGAVALQLVLDHPDLVNKLVLIDSAALGGRPAAAALLGMFWLNLFPSITANRFLSRYLLSDMKKWDADHANYTLETLNRPGGKKAFLQGKGKAVKPFLKTTLAEITSETLILWGEDDRMFNIKYGKAAADILPHARFTIIPGGGHIPLLEQPLLVENEILNFLAGGYPPS